MASINFNPFGENWFKKPPNPLQPINFQSLTESLNPFKLNSNSSPFAAISISNPFKKNPDPEPERPNYRHTPEVEKVLKDDPFFEIKENPTQEEIEENERWLKEFKENPDVKFLVRAEEVADELNEMELKANSEPIYTLYKSVLI